MEIQNESPTNSGMRKRANHSNVIIGAILITIGAFIIGNNLGYFSDNIYKIIISWQMLLIVIGAVQLYKRNTSAGIVLIAVGGFFIIPKLSHFFPHLFPWVGYNFTANFWPLLLIAIGILIMASRQSKHSCSFGHNSQYNNMNSGFRSNKRRQRQYCKESSSSPLDGNNVFGEKEYVVLDETFQGGGIKTVFGGTTIDLLNSNLKEGETILEVEAIFGGATIYVPEGWNVEFRIENVFGGVDDRRRGREVTDYSKKLIIAGKCIFGGIEVRN